MPNPLTSRARLAAWCAAIVVTAAACGSDPAAEKVAHVARAAEAKRGVDAAPEIEAGLRPDPRVDLFSIGVLMVRLLTGKLPENYIQNADCVSEDGAFDMMGNLHEWTADREGTFRGGYYMDTAINGNGCNYVTLAHDPSYHDYSIGFRCCAQASN